MRGAGSALALLIAVSQSAPARAEASKTSAAPRFVPLSHCSEPAQAVVAEEQLPGGKIVSCEARKTSIEGRKGWIVRIAHGDENDSLMAAVVDSPRSVTLLPGKSEAEIAGKVLEKLVGSMSGKRDLNCDKSIKNLEMGVGRYKSGLAWKIGFKKKFSCSWVEVRSTQVSDGKVETRGRKWVSRTGGEIFAWVHDHVTSFDISGLDQSQSQAGEVTLKDPAPGSN